MDKYREVWGLVFLGVLFLTMLLMNFPWLMAMGYTVLVGASFVLLTRADKIEYRKYKEDTRKGIDSNYPNL